MATARVPVIADLKVTAAQRLIGVPMYAAPMAKVVIPFAASDLAAKVKIAARNVNSREMVISRATGNKPLKRSSSPLNRPRPKSFGWGSGVS